MSDEEDAELIARYRASAREAPGGALDRTILRAARAAAWRRRYAGLAAGLAAACIALAILAVPMRHAPPPARNDTAANIGLDEGRARAFLLDPQAVRDAALNQRPGMTARPSE
ncbi:MAG: hypothetical protein WDM81_17780 [Rhizomicrobium sp.]